MRQLTYLTTAQDDLGEILLYIARESGSLAPARDFVARLEARCEQLASLPGTLGSARSELRQGLRSTPFQGYVIFFRSSETRMEIVNILHASRDVLAHFED